MLLETPAGTPQMEKPSFLLEHQAWRRGTSLAELHQHSQDTTANSGRTSSRSFTTKPLSSKPLSGQKPDYSRLSCYSDGQVLRHPATAWKALPFRDDVLLVKPGGANGLSAGCWPSEQRGKAAKNNHASVQTAPETRGGFGPLSRMPQLQKIFVLEHLWIPLAPEEAKVGE